MYRKVIIYVILPIKSAYKLILHRQNFNKFVGGSPPDPPPTRGYSIPPDPQVGKPPNYFPGYGLGTQSLLFFVYPVYLPDGWRGSGKPCTIYTSVRRSELELFVVSSSFIAHSQHWATLYVFLSRRAAGNSQGGPALKKKSMELQDKPYKDNNAMVELNGNRRRQQNNYSINNIGPTSFCLIFLF